eukprot:1195699-Prorocentrum_minimum.AAC.6
MASVFNASENRPALPASDWSANIPALPASDWPIGPFFSKLVLGGAEARGAGVAGRAVFGAAKAAVGEGGGEQGGSRAGKHAARPRAQHAQGLDIAVGSIS